MRVYIFNKIWPTFIGGPGALIQTQQICKAKFELGFLIDASGSTYSHFKDVLQLVISIVDNFGLSREGTHVGVVIFSNTARVVFDFGQYYDSESLKRALDAVEAPSGGTRLDIALQLTYRDLFSKKGRLRDNVPKLLFVMTDGVHESPYGIELAVKPLQALGVRVCFSSVLFIHQLIPNTLVPFCTN